MYIDFTAIIIVLTALSDFLLPHHSSDIDECANGSTTCMENSLCINTDGSYTCRCNMGFFLSSDGRCCKLTNHIYVYIIFICINAITCQYAACSDGDIRLVNGRLATEGRVEICRNNTYGTICDDQWDVLDARVACTQLGFSGQGTLCYSM